MIRFPLLLGLIAQGRRLVLLVLVQVQGMLDLVAEALAVRRVAVAIVLLLVDVSGATALQDISASHHLIASRSTYAGVVVVLGIAQGSLRDEVGGSAAFIYGPDTGRFP